MNFAFKTRSFAFKTRDSVFKMMKFADIAYCNFQGAATSTCPPHPAFWYPHK